MIGDDQAAGRPRWRHVGRQAASGNPGTVPMARAAVREAVPAASPRRAGITGRGTPAGPRRGAKIRSVPARPATCARLADDPGTTGYWANAGGPFRPARDSGRPLNRPPIGAAVYASVGMHLWSRTTPRRPGSMAAVNDALVHQADTFRCRRSVGTARSSRRNGTTGGAAGRRTVRRSRSHTDAPQRESGSQQEGSCDAGPPQGGGQYCDRCQH
jgi:hypothetical protein